MLIYVNSKERLKVVIENNCNICIDDIKFINKSYEGWIESTIRDGRVYSKFVSNEYMVNGYS